MSSPIVTWRTWAMTAFLVGTCTLAFIHRQMFSLLVEPIRQDLRFSDTELGILQGAAFSLFYGPLSIPLGMLADRVNRKRLIIGAVLAWSLMTSLTGFATGLFTMFLARAGTASGEAGMTPAATSIFPDAFPRHKLGLPISIYTCGIYIGSGLAFLLGGWLHGIADTLGLINLPYFGATPPWRIAFVVAALLGLPWSLVLALGLNVPKRHAFRAKLERAPEVTGASTTLWRFLIANRGYLLPHFVGFTLALGAVSAVLAWNPTILIRVHGMAVKTVGPIYGLLYVVCGIFGAIGGGWLSDFLAARGRREAPVDVSIFAMIGMITCSAALALTQDDRLAMAWAALAIVFIAPVLSLPPAILQMLAPVSMRAQVCGSFMMVSGVLGLSLGPIIVGKITDGLFADPMKLHFAVAALVTASNLVALPILLSGRKHFGKLQAWHG